MTVPELVGVPVTVIVPVPVPEIVKPVVLVTPDTASVTVPLPPEAVIELLYATPTSSTGSDDGLRTTGG